MTRDELIEVAAKAIAAQGFWDDLVCAELAVDAVEPLIRADEREKNSPVYIDTSSMTSEVLRGYILGLRARVEALPTWLSGSSPPVLALVRADVLALLKEN